MQKGLKSPRDRPRPAVLPEQQAHLQYSRCCYLAGPRVVGNTSVCGKLALPSAQHAET